MTQPFRQIPQSGSILMQNVVIDFRQDCLLLTTPHTYTVLSNSVWNGGMQSVHHFLNWKVPLDYDDSRPFQTISEKISSLGHSPTDTVGLQTAAKLTHASIQQVESEHFRVFCLVTAGTSNAVRAGQFRATFPGYHPGTVNVLVFIDGKLTNAAMVNAIITVTEAKTAALMDCGIMDVEHNLPATGTTTDAVVIAVSQRDCWSHEYLYCGTATEVGHAIEHIVYSAVCEAVTTQSL